MPQETTSLIDPIIYVRPPRLGVDSGLSLSKMLITMVPDEPPPGVLRMAKALARAVTELETHSRERGRSQSSRNPRPADLRLDRIWGAVQARLSAWSVFGSDDPDHVRGAELTMRLFPTGLDFLTLPYLEQHAQSERRVQIIEEENLREDLDLLVGESFIDELLDAHADYGEALGITAPIEPVDSPTSLHEPLRALAQAISSYALQLVAFADLHPDNVASARRALEPIDAFRRAAMRRQNNGRGANVDAATDGTANEVGDFDLPEGAPAPDSPMAELPAS